MSATANNSQTTENLLLLQNDINNHIKAQEDLYKKLKESDFVLDIDKQMLASSTTTDSELVNTDTINAKILELVESTGDEMAKELEYQTLINTYFNLYYTENTKLRAQYFEKINKLNKKLLDQKDGFNKLKPNLTQLETKSSTNYRQLKESKRKLSAQQYYRELYTVSAFMQAFVIVVVVLGFTNTIPKATTFIVVSILYVILAIYIVYVVLFTNTDRDVVVFDKYKFPVNKDAVTRCDTSDINKRQKDEENAINAKLVTLLDERNTKTQCLMNSSTPTTTTATTTTTTSTTTN
jgi:hypothetical protein